MASSLELYKDAGLALKCDPLPVMHNLETIDDPVVISFWLGSAIPDRQFHCSTNPGTDPLLLEIIDKKPGTGMHEITQFKLAFTSADLATAVAGAALDLGPELVGGPVNAVQIFMEATNPNRVIGSVADEIALRINNVRESILGTPLVQLQAA